MSVESYFRGRLDAPTSMGRVQERFEKELPHLLVPQGEPIALRPFELRDDRNTRSLALAYNQASYVAFQYPGSESFIPEALAALTFVHHEMKVEQLTRVAYAYDNALPIPRVDRALPLELLLRLDFPPWIGTDSFSKLDLSWERKSPETGILLQGRVFQEDLEPDTAVLRIKLRAFQFDVPVDDFESAVGRTHERASDVFETMIADAFRDYLSQTGAQRD